MAAIPDLSPLRALVWGENIHERQHAYVASLYPEGMHEAIAAPLRAAGGLAVRTVTMDMPEHGLDARTLEETDVLVWWGHAGHADVADRVVDRVRARVLAGMGLIVLHSGHHSKIFRSLMGTTGNLRWRDATDKERIWVINPAHPIAAGLPPHFELPMEEMYGEPFDVPEPEELVFVSWFTGGEVFRSGACWRRGAGRVFYFRPGHEFFPTYHDSHVQRVILNAVRWARPTVALKDECPMVTALEPLPNTPRRHWDDPL